MASAGDASTRSTSRAVSRLAGLVRTLVSEDRLTGVHDVAAGGLGLALAEMAVKAGVGVRVDGIDGPADLLAEVPGRVVVSVAPDQVEGVVADAEAAGVPVQPLGTGGGQDIWIEGLVELPLAEATTDLARPAPGRPRRTGDLGLRTDLRRRGGGRARGRARAGRG